MRAVLDTNVLASALLKPHSFPALALDAALSGKLLLVVNEAVLAEYREVLARDRFGFPDPLVAGLAAQLRDISLVGMACPQPEVLPDPFDQVFWDLARANDAVVVTGNARHFPASEHVLTPRDLIARLSGETDGHF